MAEVSQASSGEYPYMSASGGLTHPFEDFDDPDVFYKAELGARNFSTQNFVIDFGDDDALCASDLTASDYDNILRTPRPSNLHTRWINIWFPYKQKDILHAIARHYDFSPRLLAIMSTDPFRRPSRRSTPPSNRSSRSIFNRISRRSQSSSNAEITDLEKVVASLSTGHSFASESEILQCLTNHYEIVDRVWHWSSLDTGRQFVCLGYNSVYAARIPDAEVTEESLNMPEGTRVWTWLLLCKDKTVITIREDPFPLGSGSLDAQEQRVMLSIRRNLLNVFRQLSKVHDTSNENAMTILPIRKRIGDTDEETAHRSTDSPGLLFFYLFEDWFSAFNLVARRQHRYADQLNWLRECMQVKPELKHIDRLHRLGCQLGVMKRLYQSYELLIDRILEKQEASLASLKNSNIVSPQSLSSSHVHLPDPDTLLGVALSSAARVRFARLKNNIRLYALSEIQDCLDQKDALVMMNFNLIAIKESYSVERLTRITLLLAKVTMLFIPVNLMTAYFSTELVNTEFTLRGYWIAFAVVFGASCVLLGFFDAISKISEGRSVDKAASRRILDTSMSWLIEQQR